MSASKAKKKPPKFKKPKYDQRLQLFISHLLADPERNATQAAIKAHYSVRSAKTTASRLLTRTDVKQALANAHAKTVEKLEIKAEWVLEQLRRIAAFDPRKLYHADGKPKAIAELDDETATAIAGLEVAARGKIRKYRASDKRGALELLGKNLKLWTDKSEWSGPNGGPIAVQVQYAEMTDDQLREELAKRKAALGLPVAEPVKPASSGAESS